MRISDWSSDVCSSDLISKFGGHAMAAGLSLPQANFGAFAAAFDAEVRRQLCDDDLTGRLLTDGQLRVEEFHLELARALRNAGPWGQHFPEPMFQDRKSVVKGTRVTVRSDLGGRRSLKKKKEINTTYTQPN